MRIREIMSTPAATTRPEEPLDSAARMMWECDCGSIPVVDESGRLAGIVTDRDIAMAAWTKGKSLKEIATAEAMARQVYTCRPDDPIEDAEKLMSRQQIRRLPVVDGEGHPVGIVSLGDIARCTAPGGDADVARSLAEISKPRRPDQAARLSDASLGRNTSDSPLVPRERGPRDGGVRRASRTPL